MSTHDAEPFLPGESVSLELDGVVPGFTRWSAIGGVIGIVVALSVPRLFEVPFLLGAVLIVIVLGATFVAIYYGAGRPLGQRNQPPLTGPYLQLVLTDQRLLLFDRALGSPQRELVESHRRHSIVVTKHQRAGLFSPQRLEYRAASEERVCEFARSERVGKLVTELEL